MNKNIKIIILALLFIFVFVIFALVFDIGRKDDVESSRARESGLFVEDIDDANDKPDKTESDLTK